MRQNIPLLAEEGKAAASIKDATPKKPQPGAKRERDSAKP